MFKVYVQKSAYCIISYGVVVVALFLMSRCVMCSTDAVAETSPSDIWDEIFNVRNDDEWRQLWHVERHRRCYQDLENHMRWVCDKDIYKVNAKKSTPEQQHTKGIIAENLE